MFCPNMKLTTLESVGNALVENRHVIRIADDIATRARRAVERMVSIG
jgi:quinolinate synthase